MRKYLTLTVIGIVIFCSSVLAAAGSTTYFGNVENVNVGIYGGKNRVLFTVRDNGNDLKNFSFETDGSPLQDFWFSLLFKEVESIANSAIKVNYDDAVYYDDGTVHWVNVTAIIFHKIF